STRAASATRCATFLPGLSRSLASLLARSLSFLTRGLASLLTCSLTSLLASLGSLASFLTGGTRSTRGLSLRKSRRSGEAHQSQCTCEQRSVITWFHFRLSS